MLPILLYAVSNLSIAERISSSLNKLGVQTELTDFKYWNRNPVVDVLNETEDQLKKKVKNCCAVANMVTLIQGKIFFCGFSAFYDYYTAAPLPHTTCSEDCIAW